jgi:DNA-binding GntR family transcriptional regulator
MNKFAHLASHKAYQHLKTQITTGQLPPGTRLVRRTLAKELGVSPIPVMEALFLLERDGLVESGPNETARVRGWSLGQLRNDQALREAIECQVAFIIAEQVPADELAEVEKIAELLDSEKLHFLNEEGTNLVVFEGQQITQKEATFRRHAQFHVALAELTHFSELRDELNRIWMRRMTFLRWLPHPKTETPKNWHMRLVQALKSGSMQTAVDAMREHCRFGQSADMHAVIRHETSGKLTRHD